MKTQRRKSWPWYLAGACILLGAAYWIWPLPSQIDGQPIEFGYPQARPAGACRVHHILNALAKQRGQVLIDIEQGGFAQNGFDHLIDFDRDDYYKTLQDLLGSEGWGCEIRGPALVLYDKKLRTLGEQYPLNRTISSLKLNNVSLKKCFAAIGREVHARIIGDAGPMIGSNPSVPLHDFSVELTNITVHEALYKIASQYGCLGWQTYTYTMGNKTYVSIYIQ